MHSCTHATPGVLSFWHTMPVLEFADVVASSLLADVKILRSKYYGAVSLLRSGTGSSSSSTTSRQHSLTSSSVDSLSSPKRLCIGNQVEISFIACKKDSRLNDYEACISSGPSKKSSGNRIEASCFMCRKYTNEQVKTSFACVACNTPICLKSRTSLTRGSSCIDEHLMSLDLPVKCDGHRKGKFPALYKLVN